MLSGTKREVLEILLEGDQTPTEIAAHLDVSVQTASRNLKQLAEMGFVEESSRNGNRSDKQRGYKSYRAVEFAQVFAAYEGTLLDRTLKLDLDKKVMLSIWQIPQPEFHPVLASYIFTPEERFEHVRALGVYGSVARGEAKQDSDVDVLIISDDAVETDEIYSPTVNWKVNIGNFRTQRVITEEWLTITDFTDGLAAGSQFLRNVLDEIIALYDPEDLIRDAR